MSLLALRQYIHQIDNLIWILIHFIISILNYRVNLKPQSLKYKLRAYGFCHDQIQEI